MEITNCTICGKILSEYRKAQNKDTCSRSCAMKKACRNSEVRRRRSLAQKAAWSKPGAYEKRCESLAKAHKNSETLKRHSEASKANWQKESFRQIRAEAMARPEVKQKISDRTREALNTPEIKERCKQAMARPEVRKKISESLKKTYATTDARDKIRRSTINRFKKPEERQKISKSIKALLRDPEKSFNRRYKSYLTMKKNGTFPTSGHEAAILELLKLKFSTVEQPYMTKEYPFMCDFYIKDIDLYLEYNGCPEHQPDLGFYDSKNSKHIARLETLQNSHNTNAIKVWTKSDLLKRDTAKQNNLNWLAFFTMKDFIDWYNKQ